MPKFLCPEIIALVSKEKYLLYQNPPKYLAPQPGHNLLPDDGHVDHKYDCEDGLQRVQHRDLGQQSPQRLVPPPNQRLEEPPCSTNAACISENNQANVQR